MAIEQKPRRLRIKVDAAIQSDLYQSSMVLQELAKKQEVNTPLQNWIKKRVAVLKASTTDITVIFLTERTNEEAVQMTAKWMEIDKDSLAEVYNETITAIPLTTTTTQNIYGYHADTFLKQQKEVHESTVKLIICDPEYIKKYEHKEVLLAVLEKHPALHLIALLTADATEKESALTIKNSIHTVALSLATTVASFQELLEKEEVNTYRQIADLKCHILTVKQAYQLVVEDLEAKEKQLQGKSILVQKKQLETKQQDEALSSKEIGVLKSTLDGDVKQITRYIEDRIDTFEKEDVDYVALQEEINSFLGFVTQKNGKYIHMKIAEEAIAHRVTTSGTILITFFQQVLDQIQQQTRAIEDTVISKFNTWNLKTTAIVLPEISNVFTKEIVASSNLLPEKTYEKQLPFKGLGTLFMELRTPLFMLMPFMMIFGLFGALVEGEDKGIVDHTKLFYENRPSIAIQQLPEARNNEYRRFIIDVEKLRIKAGTFDKEINSELVTEPQLAVKTVQVPSSYGGKMKNKETLDYHFDNKNQMIYIYLNENADRNFVLEKLFDPTLKLLSIPASSGRSGMGIGGIIRALSGLKEYRYLIMVALVGLITWFISTRKASMDEELQITKEREQTRLNTDLKHHIDKGVKQSLQKWRTKAIEEVHKQQETFFNTVEKIIARSITEHTHQKLAEQKLAQKRTAALKSEKTKLSALKGEHRKIKSKLDQLDTKIKRLIKV